MMDLETIHVNAKMKTAWTKYSKNKEGLDEVDEKCFYAGWLMSEYYIRAALIQNQD